MKLLIAIPGDDYKDLFDAEASWFADLSEKVKKAYLKLHPNSKYHDGEGKDVPVDLATVKRQVQQLRAFLQPADDYFDGIIEAERKKRVPGDALIDRVKRAKAARTENARARLKELQGHLQHA